MKIVEVFNIWANSNRVPSKAGKLDRYLLSRMLQLETLERRITPATFPVVNTLDTGAGSLKDAITLANTTAGNDQIIFNLTGTTPYTITLGLALPTIVSASTAIVTGGTAGTVTITGLGASSLTINGNNGNFSIFSIASGGDLSISGVTVSGAQTSSQGGAFNNSGTLNIANSTISGNTAGTGGGGIFNSGTLNIANSTISGNTSNSGAGGIVNNSGTFSISNSTISGNTTSTGAGGGINNNNGGTLNIANSTISGNTAGTGGGINNNSGGTITVSSSTISGNTAGTGGGINNNSGGTLNIANTIIANSTNGTDYAGTGTVTLISPATSASNLVTQTGALVSAWATTVTSAQLNLGPLQNNGGTTFTMALGTGSVAIGAGNATISNAAPILGLDQRGFSRITSDIGAYAFSNLITVTTILDTINSTDGVTSLREAITLANAHAGPDIINFSITGTPGAVQTITLATALPVITGQVTIDGTTQNGYSPNTLSVGAGNNAAIKIQLNNSAPGASGLDFVDINSTNSSVVGLSFINFSFAIAIRNQANGITIKGNYFGLDANGTAQSNGLSGTGIEVNNASSVTVGGNTAVDQNVFGNLNFGILQVAGSGSSFTGNRIGLGTTNTSFMPNTTGIQINNNANVDALNHSISANLIGKNTTGIKLIGLQGGTGTVTGTQIVGNLIGTDSPGSAISLGNSGDAISIDNGVINTTIGNSVKPNTIAYSNQNGVFIIGAASVGNTIQNNNIRNNLGLGILLLNGANNNIASPVITQQLANGAGGFTYSGFVNGVANTQYTVDFYSSLISDSRSQGANYLGSTTVTTDANGNIGFTGFAPTQNQTSQGAVYVVTATATNINIGTSQFSAGPPAQISVVSGSSQIALVGTAFANPLTAKVVDSRGDPVPNIQVQFAAPNSNPPTNPATGLFAGSLQSIIAITNTVGQAASTTLTANNVLGNFIVLSSVVGNPGTNASFALTNTQLAPTITSFTPTAGPSGTSVVVTGTNFTGASIVRFGGVTATGFAVNSATQITATVPVGAPTGPISVTTPGGTVNTATNFTVASLAPTITSFTPTAGPTGSSVVITGTNFTGASIVRFGGVTATGFAVNSATQITATVPVGAPTGPISVTTPGGTVNTTSNFTVASLASTITSFTPTAGPTGTSVVISGSGFGRTTGVRFNGQPTGFAVNSATQITATVPVGATTGTITVITPDGTVNTTTIFTIDANTVASFKVEPANPGQQVFVGVPVSIKITALNSTGGVVTNFVGFVNTSTTDLSANIPANIAFVAGDNGVAAITAIFRTSGPVIVTANFSGRATGSGSGIVLQGANGPFQVSSPSAPVPFPLGISITKDLAILTGVTAATLSDYVATIVWGDGSQNSAGTITPSPNQTGVFQVLGTHTYSSLEVFSGSVTVTRISDKTSSSSGFNAVVLTPAQKDKVNGASGAILPPRGRTADAGVNGFNAFYKQPANNSSPVILFTASYVSNPQPYTTTAPAQNFFDIRLTNPEAGATLTLTANFSGGLQRGSSPYIQFAQDTSTSYQNVVSANNLVVINYIDSTITVYIDQSSFPLINNLRGTVFAVVTNTTQVSSNTITILPAAFTSGTAVGIAWGASSTLADVAGAANASNTTLTFQNSRQTTLSLAPSQSKGTVILRAMNNGGTTNDEASNETIKQLTNPDMLQNLIRGTIGIGPEVIGGMIKKMLPQNLGAFFKEWSKVISETQTIPNDIITPEVKGTPAPKNNAPAINPDDCDLSLIEDTAFEDISYLHTVLLSEDESDSCLNGVSSDSMLEELAFCGEINWAGLALSTLTLSQFRTFSKDKIKRVRPIKVGA